MHLQLVHCLTPVVRARDESALGNALFVPAQRYHHAGVVPADADVPVPRVDPERPGPGPHAESPYDCRLGRREEPGLLEVPLQPVRAGLVIAHDLRLVVEEKGSPLPANPHRRMDRAPMNLVNAPEPVGIAVIVKGPTGLHPLMPGPDVALHGLQRQLKAHGPQVLAHALRHPVIDFIDLAHAKAPIRSVSEGVEGENVEGDATAQPLDLEGEALPRFPWEGEGSEGIAQAQPSDFEGVGESPSQYNCPMNNSNRNLELTKADLHGHAPEDLACNQCSGAFCGSRAGRIFEGKPLIMCGQKEEVKEILASLSRR